MKRVFENWTWFGLILYNSAWENTPVPSVSLYTSILGSKRGRKNVAFRFQICSSISPQRLNESPPNLEHNILAGISIYSVNFTRIHGVVVAPEPKTTSYHVYLYPNKSWHYLNFCLLANFYFRPWSRNMHEIMKTTWKKHGRVVFKLICVMGNHFHFHPCQKTHIRPFWTSMWYNHYISAVAGLCLFYDLKSHAVAKW